MSQRVDNGAGRNNRNAASSGRGQGSNTSGGRVGRGVAGQSQTRGHVKPQGYGGSHDIHPEGPPGRSPEGGGHVHATSNSHVPSPYSSPGPANGAAGAMPQHHRSGSAAGSQTYGAPGGGAIMFGSLDYNEVAIPNGHLGSPIVQGPGVGNPHWNASHGQPPMSQAHGVPYSNGPSGTYSSSPVQIPRPFVPQGLPVHGLGGLVQEHPVTPGHSHVGMSGPQGMGAGPPVTLPAPGPQQHVTPAKAQSTRQPYVGQQGRYNEQQIYPQPPGLQAQPQYYPPYPAAGYAQHMGGAPAPFPGQGGQHSQGPQFGGAPYEQPRKSSKLKIVDPNTGKEVLPDQRRGSDRPASAVPPGGSASMPQQAFNHGPHHVGHVGPGSPMGGGPPPSALISDMHQNQYHMQQAAARQGPRGPPGLPPQVHAMQGMGGYLMQPHAMPNMPFYGNPPSEEIQELARGGQGRRTQQGQASGPVPYSNTASDANYGKMAGPNSRTNMMPGVTNVQPTMQHVGAQQMRGPPPNYRSYGPPGPHERGASMNPDGRTLDSHYKPPQSSTGRARAGRSGHQGGRGGVPLQNQSSQVSANLDAKRGNTAGGTGRQMQMGTLPPQARDKKEKEGKLAQVVASEEAAPEATRQLKEQAAKPQAAPEAAQPVEVEGADAETKQHPDSQAVAEPKATPEGAETAEQLVAETAPVEAKAQVEDQPAELKPAEGGAEVPVSPAAEEAAPAAELQDQTGEGETAEAGDGAATETAVVEDQPAELKQNTEAADVAQSLAAAEAAAQAKQQAEEAARQAEEEAARKEAAEAAEKLAAEEAAAEAKQQAEAAELKAAADAEKLKAEEAAAEEKRQADAQAAKAKEEAEAEEKRQAEAQATKLREQEAERFAAEEAAALREAAEEAAELKAAADAAEMQKKAEEEQAQKAKEEAELAEAEAARKQEAEKEAAAAASSTGKDQAVLEAEKAAEPETEGAASAHEVDRPADEVEAVVAAESNGQAPREISSHAVSLPEDEDTDDAAPPGKPAPMGSKQKRKLALAKAATRPAAGDLLDAFSEGPKPAAEPIATPAPDAAPTTPSAKAAAAALPVAREGTRSGVEDDWESAAIGTPDASRSAQPAAASAAAPIPSGKLTYTKDFLMLFKDKCNVRPPGLTDKGLGELDVGSTGGREPPGVRAGPQFDQRGMGHRGAGMVMGGRGGPPVEDQWKRVGPPIPPHGGHMQGHGGNRGMMGAPGAHMGATGSGRGGLDGDQWQRRTPLPPAPGVPGGGGHSAPRLHKAAQGFKVGYVPPEDAEETKRQKEIKGLLNKITPEKYDRIRDQLLAVDYSNHGTLRGLIDQVFDKALGEPTFCEIYAQLCFDLSQKLPVFPAIPPNEETGDPGREEMTFRRELLNKCQIEFEEGAAAFLAVARREKAEAEAQLEEEKEEGEINVEDAAAKKLLEHKAAEAERKARMRALGNIQFIGQLYKKRMLIEKIMHECIKSLLQEHDKPKAEEIECLCKLLTTIGIQIDNANAKAKEKIDVYFRRIGDMSKNMKLESRHRFMLRDLMDLRASKWQVRRKVEGPKTIDEIHRDARDEAMQQAARAAAPPDRRDRDRDRRGLIDARPAMRGERPRFDTVDGPIRAMARAPSQDFGASLRPGGAGGRFPEVSLRPGAGPSAGRPVSNPRAGTPPKDAAIPTVASASNGSRMSENDVKQELTALLTEFFSARDQQAVDGRIAELVEKRADFGFVVTTLFSNAITTKGLDAGKVEAFVKMMAQMGSTKDSPAPHADLGKGLLVTIRQHLTGFLEDNPRHACPMVGEVAGAWIAADIITLEQVATATLEAGASDEPEPEEEPELKGSGKAIDFMCHVLKQVAMGRGSEGVAALWKATGHKLEEFVAEVDTDTAADIVKKQATEFGLEALL